MTFYVDTTNITGGGLITSTTDTTPVVFQGFPVTATSVPIVIQPVTITGINTTSADYAATDTIEVILGPTDDAPIGGTFTLTLGSTTSSALAYNISEDDMQTAFAALCTAEGKIAPTVTKIADGVWRVTGNADGAIGSTGVCTIETEQLEPTSYGKVLEADLGSASDPYSLLIVVRQSPLAYASSFTISSPNYTGTLTVNTVEMYEYAQRQADDPFYVPFSIRRTRASGEVATIYGPVLVPIRKESLNPLTAIPTGFGSFAVGDLLYASSTSTLSRLTVGTNGYHLVVSGGLPAWAAAASSVPTTITVANEASDTTCFPMFVTAATGDLGPKTNAGLTYNSSSGALGVGSAVLTSAAGEQLIVRYDATNLFRVDVQADGAAYIYAEGTDPEIRYFATLYQANDSYFSGTAYLEGAVQCSFNASAANSSAISVTGAWDRTSASASAQLLIAESGATAFSGSTSGTGLGINMDTASGNFIDCQVDGTSNFSLSNAGTLAVRSGTNSARSIELIGGTSGLALVDSNIVGIISSGQYAAYLSRGGGFGVRVRSDSGFQISAGNADAAGDVTLNRQSTSTFGIGASGAATGTGGNLSLNNLTAGGTVTMNGGVVATPQAETTINGAAAAANLTTLTSTFVTGASSNTTTTLAAGTNGQIKIISLITDGGFDLVVTVTNPFWGGAGTLTFNDAGDNVMLIYLNSKWQILANNGVTAA